MELMKRSDVVLIGRIVSDVEPIEGVKSLSNSLVHNVMMSMFELHKCSFKMMPSTIVHLQIPEVESKDLPMDRGVVEVNTIVPPNMAIRNGDCIMIHGSWTVVPDKTEKYKCVIEGVCSELIDRNLIVEEHFLKSSNPEHVRFRIMDNRF